MSVYQDRGQGNPQADPIPGGGPGVLSDGTIEFTFATDMAELKVLGDQDVLVSSDAGATWERVPSKAEWEYYESGGGTIHVRKYINMTLRGRYMESKNDIPVDIQIIATEP